MEHLLKLFLLGLVFFHLSLGLIGKPFKRFHESFDLRLLVVELLHFYLVTLVLLDILRRHHTDLLLQLVQSGLLQRDSLARISLLFSELHVLRLLLLARSLRTWHGLGHLLLSLAGHGGSFDEFIMDCLDCFRK